LKDIIKDYNVPREKVIYSSVADSKIGIKYGNLEAFVMVKEGLCVLGRSDELIIMYNSSIQLSELNRFVRLGMKYKRKTLSPLKKFHMIVNGYGLDLQSFDVTKFSIDVNTHYNEDFHSINNLIVDSLTSNKKGIVLLHGNYGTGKTFYLRHLINTIDRKFIYFPVNMTEILTSPEFIPFIAGHRNSVLILEDIESLLVNRESGPANSSALSNLLNLGDGLLADALNINIICTFNTNLKQIDKAFLRKGRLIARYEFKELEIEKAQHLINSLGYDMIIDKPMTVSEVYNARDMDFEAKKNIPVGF
jgi:hypothetical protein